MATDTMENQPSSSKIRHESGKKDDKLPLVEDKDEETSSHEERTKSKNFIS